jgi:hypothetical protein
MLVVLGTFRRSRGFHDSKRCKRIAVAMMKSSISSKTWNRDSINSGFLIIAEVRGLRPDELDSSLRPHTKHPFPSFGGFGFVKINYVNINVAQIGQLSIGRSPYAGRRPAYRAAASSIWGMMSGLGTKR